MRTLRKGATGIDVIQWQNFVRGLLPDSTIIVSGIFDDITELETQRFQKMSLLVTDGVVGPSTYATALKLGLHIVTDDSDDENGPNWPQSRTDISFISPVNREKLFGKFSYVPSPVQWNPEAITITDNWAIANIVLVEIPQLKSISGAPKDGKISFHKNGANQLVTLFAEWEAAGLMDRIITWCGSYAPRFVRGSRTYLSNHAWGTAFDINAQWNGLGSCPALKNQKGSVRELVEIANNNGFGWGGAWKDRPDGMHWEICNMILP